MFIVALIVGLAVLFLSVNIILRGGKFRSLHIGQSPDMRKHGIHCVQSMDAIERRKDPHAAVKMERGQGK